MAILSRRVTEEVGKLYRRSFGLNAGFMDPWGRVSTSEDPLGILSNARRKREYALQQSISVGGPYIFQPAAGMCAWIVALEDKRMVHGGLLGGEVLADDSDSARETARDYLQSHGMPQDATQAFVARLPVWSESKIREASEFLKRTFYQVSGWEPELMEENRLRLLQQEQLNRAIEDQRRSGQQALYAFEKERLLLASIRAGDRSGARKVLNEMLATIYLSSPKLVVLRARAVELMSCLTRAAIEDNTLLEPLIERNHAWTERLVAAADFEALSQDLMAALDDFIEEIYLQGVNRRNAKVSQALEFIGRNFARRIALRDVAREVGLSPSRLAHLAKEFTGRSIVQLIHQTRLSHAQKLLQRTTKNCTEIAYEVGFGDQSYFIKHFRRLTGTTPKRFRASYRQG